MKIILWLSWLVLLVTPAAAQSLAGTWQGVEDPEATRSYPAVLRLQRGPGEALFGILYQEASAMPGVSVTFQMAGTRTSTGAKLTHGEKLDETGESPDRYWCEGRITFTYDAAQEKLTGHAVYDPYGQCDTGEFTFYRVKLKSTATVKAGVPSTLRVSGRDVRWYADAARTKLLASGNAYPTRLAKTTTFYITQGYFPSAQSQATPVTVAVTGAARTPPPTARPAPAPAAPALAAPAPPRPAPDTTTRRPAPPVVAAPTLPTGPAPLVLPTVLFQQSTPELLPSAYGALDELAAELRAQPDVRLRIVGHTDRLAQDDPAKNQQLSEQRAAAVKAYLVKAGVAADRLATAGYGDTRRLYPSPDVRNRRVEVERLP